MPRSAWYEIVSGEGLLAWVPATIEGGSISAELPTVEPGTYGRVELCTIEADGSTHREERARGATHPAGGLPRKLLHQIAPPSMARSRGIETTLRVHEREKRVEVASVHGGKAAWTRSTFSCGIASSISRRAALEGATRDGPATSPLAIDAPENW